MTVVMLLVCQTRRGDFGYIGGHMQWSYVYVQLSDCGEDGMRRALELALVFLLRGRMMMVRRNHARTENVH